MNMFIGYQDAPIPLVIYHFREIEALKLKTPSIHVK